MSETTKLKKALREPKKPEVLTRDMYLSSGCPPFDLACTGKTWGAYIKGRYYLRIGDSDTGKTWEALTTLAEAANNPAFDDYLLIHDEPESKFTADIKEHFGTKLAARLQPPRYWKDGRKRPSRTVEEFYDNLARLFREGKKFIYILDSQDALRSHAEEKKEAQNEKIRAKKEAREEGDRAATDAKIEEEKGSMGDGKAKYHSTHLPGVVYRLGKTGSILIILNQTRDNIGWGSQFNPKVYSGGTALKFYATLQIWSALVRKIKKKVLGKSRERGSLCSVRIRKNHITGRDRTVLVPIIQGYGVDGVRACVDFLIDEGKWQGDPKAEKEGKDEMVKAPDFNFEGKKSKLILHIEEQGLEKDLRMLVKTTWDEIEEALAEKGRKKRYE